MIQDSYDGVDLEVADLLHSDWMDIFNQLNRDYDRDISNGIVLIEHSDVKEVKVKRLYSCNQVWLINKMAVVGVVVVKENLGVDMLTGIQKVLVDNDY